MSNITSNKPMIVQHVRHPVNYTPQSLCWIRKSARIVCVGSHARGTGALKVFKLADGGKLAEVKSSEKAFGFRACCMYGADLQERFIATGDMGGRLSVFDLEHTDLPLWTVAAHATSQSQPGSSTNTAVVNAIASCGGVSGGFGAPELVSAGSDGCVRVWDTRQSQNDGPVASLVPDTDVDADTNTHTNAHAHDCWAVTFGDASSSANRCVLSGWDNGDLKLFDLRMNRIRWETNLGSGIVSVDFDRKDIEMNKFVVGMLEGNIKIFEGRTQHPTKGFASLQEKAHKGTVWAVKHSPDNRDVFASCGGGGDLRIWKYRYPDQRRRGEGDEAEGVVGQVELLTSEIIHQMPVVTFDWSVDRPGLCAYGSLDGSLHVGIVTKLNTL